MKFAVAVLGAATLFSGTANAEDNRRLRPDQAVWNDNMGQHADNAMMRQEISGVAKVRCSVQPLAASGRPVLRDCTTVSADPETFSDSAARAARALRLRPGIPIGNVLVSIKQDKDGGLFIVP